MNARPDKLGILLIGLALLCLAPAPAGAETNLAALARVGPWSGVSELIGYGERLWFVNSVKFVNHNSADLYSYDPASGGVRYEHHLFSQDAGEPVLAGGLLYWPFEDPRFSAGRGEYMVTNGRDWQWRALPEGTAFHVHAMAGVGESLVAATSAWRAGLQRSDDGGVTWGVIYDHATEPGSVSRITSLAALGGTLYAGLTAWAQDGVKLLGLAEGAVEPLAGWPEGHSTRALTAWRGWLYAVNMREEESALWRTDGRRVEPVSALDAEWVRALAAGPRALWAVTVGGEGGALWRSEDGAAWTREQRFADQPLDVAVYAGRVYVGAKGADGRGVLWGPPPPAPAAPALAPAALPPAPAPLDADRVPALLAALDRALADTDDSGHYRRALLAALGPLALSGRARVGATLGDRLDGALPDGEVELFGGNLALPAATLARWYLLRSMALSGGGRVPAKLLAAPFSARPNGAEKYFSPAPGAAFTAARLGQADDETLAALVERLGRERDPLWLTGDIVGALGALTGKRFGYDQEAWRAWWRHRRVTEE